MSDESNERDDATQDPQLRDFLTWRASVGPRPRGSAATAQAIAGRLDALRDHARSTQRLVYAVGSAAVIVLVLAAAALVFLRLPEQGPATPPSPSPTVVPSPSAVAPGACPPRGSFVPGAASAEQRTDLWAERIEGDIGSGAVVFPTPVHPGSAGQRELWFADGTLGSPRLIASLGTNDAAADDAYDIRAVQVSANRAAVLVEIYVPVPSDDPLATCAEWFVVSTSATESRVSRVAGPTDDILAASLAPDGTRVAFVIYSPEDGVGNAHLDVRDATGASLGSTLIVTAINSHLAWSPDSDQVAVASGTWAAKRGAVATNWAGSWVMTGFNGEPENVIWPTESGPPIAVFAQWNESADGFVGFPVMTLLDTGHQFLTTVGEGEGPWAPRAELSPDGRLLRASHFVSGQYVDVVIDLAAPSPSMANLNSDFNARWPLTSWQWSRDSAAIEQSAATDTGAQIVSVPIGDAAAPETALVTFTTLWGNDHEWVIGRTAWIGP